MWAAPGHWEIQKDLRSGGWGWALTGLESSRTQTAHHAGVKRVPESPVVSVISKGSYSYRRSLSFRAFILKPDSSTRYKSILVDLKRLNMFILVWVTFHQGFDSIFLVSNPNLTEGKTQNQKKINKNKTGDLLLIHSIAKGQTSPLFGDYWLTDYSRGNTFLNYYFLFYFFSMAELNSELGKINV